jgi:hypothetical protein
MIISVPVQIAVWESRALGAPVVVVGTHASVAGLYRPPVLTVPVLVLPPQTIISIPVQTAVCRRYPSGAPVVVVGTQMSAAGSYRPPVAVPP